MAQRKPTVSGMNFRTTVTERSLIDRAARALDMKPGDYARRSVMKQVEMDLAAETEFEISAQAMTDFLAALDRPPQAKPGLKKLLTEKSILE